MQPNKSFLVALMFVTILTMGIGTILASLASIVVSGTRIHTRAVRYAWIAFVLLAYFELFWRADFFLNIERWSFAEFLLVITGPVLLLLATNVLIASVTEEDAPNSKQIDSRALVLLILLQGWIAVIYLRFVGVLVAANALDGALVVIFVAMLVFRSDQAHKLGTGAAFVVYLGSVMLLGLGVIS